VGVTLFASQGKFQAFVKVDGRRIHLGMWRHEVDAAIARDRYLLFLGADRARLQVPIRSLSLGAASAEELARLARLREHQGRSSRYFGVSWNTQRALWEVQARVAPGKTELIAKFHDERDAVIAYDRFLLHRGAPAAQRNFPELQLEPLTLDEVRTLARAKRKERTSSRFRGVVWLSLSGGWIAKIAVGRRNRSLGSFGDEVAAAHAYDAAAIALLGEDALLNFDPVTGEERPGGCRPTAKAIAAAKRMRRGSHDSSR